MEDKRELVELGAVDLEEPMRAADEGDVVRIFVVLDGCMDGLIGGVGEQAFFVGVDGVEEAFAAEVAVFDDREGAAVERKAGGVGDPERAEGLGDAVVGVGDERDGVGG